jgi:pilus assembly protein CpaC
MVIVINNPSKGWRRSLACGVYGAAVLWGLMQAPMADASAVRRKSHAATAGKVPVAVPGLPVLAAPAIGVVPFSSYANSDSQQMHVLVGRSLFINTLTRLKRVYVSNPAVIDSFTSNPSQIVVTAKSPGVSSLILWDESGQSQTYNVSSDIDVASLRDSIRVSLPNDVITVEAQQDRVSLSGLVTSDASAQAATKLAALYTKNVVNALLIKQAHVLQVKLKVQMLEIDRSKLDAFGLNFFSQGKNTSAVSTGQFGSFNTTSSSGSPSINITNPLNLLFYNSSLNVGLTIQDLQNKQVLQILAEPTLTAISGQKASFLSGGEFPFPVIQGSSSGLTSITIQFRQYGVKLEFTPQVNPDRTIQLQVSPEVSALDYTNAVTISGYTIPALSTRRAETEVELQNGQSFAISGLLDNRTTDMLSKIPGVGDLPVLGQLFRSKNINHSVVELVVVVTPTIVDPLTDTTGPTLPTFPLPLLDAPQFDKKLGGAGAQPKTSGGTAP